MTGKKKTYARCGEPIDQFPAAAFRGDQHLYYHHEALRDCYTTATWAGYPEFEKGAS